MEETELHNVIESEEPQTEGVLNKLFIEEALKRLPDEFREVIILHYFQELKLAEIADILNIGLPLVKYRLKQARMKLENLLRKGGEL